MVQRSRVRQNGAHVDAPHVKDGFLVRVLQREQPSPLVGGHLHNGRAIFFMKVAQGEHGVPLLFGERGRIRRALCLKRAEQARGVAQRPLMAGVGEAHLQQQGAFAARRLPRARGRLQVRPQAAAGKELAPPPPRVRALQPHAHVVQRRVRGQQPRAARRRHRRLQHAAGRPLAARKDGGQRARGRSTRGRRPAHQHRHLQHLRVQLQHQLVLAVNRLHQALQRGAARGGAKARTVRGKSRRRHRIKVAGVPQRLAARAAAQLGWVRGAPQRGRVLPQRGGRGSARAHRSAQHVGQQSKGRARSVERAVEGLHRANSSCPSKLTG